MTAKAYLILVLFLVWSAFSWWWYTCKIKNLCSSSIVQTSQMADKGQTERRAQGDEQDQGNPGSGQVEDAVNEDSGNPSQSNTADESSDLLETEEEDSNSSNEMSVDDMSSTEGQSSVEDVEGSETGSGLNNPEGDNDNTNPTTESINSDNNEKPGSSSGNGIVRLSDRTLIYFEYLSDQPQINTETQNYLNQIANDLSQDKYKSIRVTGFTDNIGNTKNNYYKGLDRARAIQEYLMTHGARENQIELKSFGEYRPVADNATEDGRAKNRRVEIKLNY